MFVLLTAQISSAYYCPSTGRWLSRDPLGEPGFENLRAAKAGKMVLTQPARWIQRDSISAKNDPDRYAFVCNNSINSIDILGLSPGTPTATCCKCLRVQVGGKPTNPPNIGWYIDGTRAMYGNLMTVTWTVSGNPHDCTYGQDEKGYSDAKAATGGGSKYATYSNHPDVSGIVPITFGSNTATYQDYMGLPFSAPDDDGGWKYFIDLSIDFTCTSSDGSKITGQHLDYRKSGSMHF